jgi:GTP pyrophosphokinase
VPIAGQLGIALIKTELENLSLKYLNPIIYKHISKFIASQKKEQEEFQENIEKKLKQAAKEEDIEIEISPREKNIYSIYRKMTSNETSAEETNTFSIRILCNTANDCYAVLGILHKLWIPVERRFKDYITAPKANKYRSLHTTVITDDGKLLEIHICTFEMHKIAEYGVAAHWLNKKGETASNSNSKNISLVNKLKQWDTLENYEKNFLNDLKKEILKDTIIVFTPEGEIFEMPTGSTAIDLAYNIHTAVGNHAAGAKADGYTIPLGMPLKNTQVVEIITDNNAYPTPQWLKIAKTSKAKSKIRTWLKKNKEEKTSIKNSSAITKDISNENKVILSAKGTAVFYRCFFFFIFFKPCSYF